MSKHVLKLTKARLSSTKYPIVQESLMYFLTSNKTMHTEVDKTCKHLQTFTESLKKLQKDWHNQFIIIPREVERIKIPM